MEYTSTFHYLQVVFSSYAENATLLHKYFTYYGARVWVYSLRLNTAVSAEELQSSLELTAPAMTTRVVLTRREGTLDCYCTSKYVFTRHYK